MLKERKEGGLKRHLEYRHSQARSIKHPLNLASNTNTSQEKQPPEKRTIG